MDLGLLKEKCIVLYGNSVGNGLFFAMKMISQKDFCVATGWTEKEISISRGCNYRGSIFRLTGDYEGIILPKKNPISIDRISHEDIERYLPKLKFNGDYRHCDADKKNMKDPKEWLAKLF